MNTFKLHHLNLTSTTGVAALLLAVVGLAQITGTDSRLTPANHGPIPFVAMTSSQDDTGRLDKDDTGRLDKDDGGRLDKDDGGTLDKSEDGRLDKNDDGRLEKTAESLDKDGLDKDDRLGKEGDLGGSLLF